MKAPDAGKNRIFTLMRRAKFNLQQALSNIALMGEEDPNKELYLGEYGLAVDAYYDELESSTSDMVTFFDSLTFQLQTANDPAQKATAQQACSQGDCTWQQILALWREEVPPAMETVDYVLGELDSLQL